MSPTSVRSIRRQAPELVAPAGATPGGRLPLSCMDRAAVVRVLVDLVLVFKRGPSQPAVAVIRSALARALVPYYPVAGRIVESSAAGGGSVVEVECTGDGVWFVEAAADCGLEEVNDLERPLALPKEELVPFAPGEVNEEQLIFLMQVTSFTCGGFAVGIRFSHTVFDGVGAARFLQAVAELARGHARLVVDPVWCRDAIPNPPKLSPGGGPPISLRLGAFRFQTAVFDVSDDRIDLIKNHFSRETGRQWSTFDVVTAATWQCRTRAVSLPPEANVHLGFAANTRHLLRHLLPQEGSFYGNCVYPMAVEASSGRIAGASLVEVMELIRAAKERMPGEFLDWLTRDSSGGREDPYIVPADYGTMVVSDWSRVGFAEVDCGWGEPLHVLPLNDDHNFIASCIFLQPSKPKKGTRVMTRCVEEEHLSAFEEEMSNLFNLHPSSAP